MSPARRGDEQCAIWCANLYSVAHFEGKKTPSTPLVLLAVPPDEGGTREAQRRFALSHWGRKIRVIPRPIRSFGEVLHHNGVGVAL